PRAFFIAAIVVALSARVAADPIYHLKTPSSVTTDGGTNLRLPPGYFLDEDTWAKRDAELKQAQEDAIRFKAENVSLRQSATETFGWKAIGCAVAFGLVSGVIAYKMTE